MAVFNIDMLGMVKEQSKMSHSFASFQVRNYVDTVTDNTDRFANMLTDLRDASVRLEMNTGKIVQKRS